METKWCHNVTWKLGYFPASERGVITYLKNWLPEYIFYSAVRQQSRRELTPKMWKKLKNGNITGDKPMKERRYDIDWLRVLAILVIFIFHNARFFPGTSIMTTITWVCFYSWALWTLGLCLFSFSSQVLVPGIRWDTAAPAATCSREY